MPNTTNADDIAVRTANESRREPPFGAPHIFVLAVIDGDDASVVHRIVRQETIIGRGEECHFAIEEEKLSRVHCRIRVEGPVCSIVDADSRNGTWVNGRRLVPNTPQRLRHLDEIEIGGHQLLLLAGRFRGNMRKGMT